MPSHRQRSDSRERSGSPMRDRSRSRSQSPSRRVPLPAGVSEISESDYFLKSDEFRVWLKEDRRKYFNELSGDRARKYFRKFVKAWNRGKLSKSLYMGVNKAQTAGSQTSYKWSFASKSSRAENEALRTVRDEIDDATYNRSQPVAGPGTSTGRILDPSMPTASDRVLANEAENEYRSAERDYQRKREKKAAKERVEDMVGPKETGRAGMLEKKKAQREANRAFRDKGDDGFDVDDSTLMGGGDSFRAQIARRDAAKRRFEEKKEERMSSVRERTGVMREKDKATMDMFMQLAKERFG